MLWLDIHPLDSPNKPMPRVFQVPCPVPITACAICQVSAHAQRLYYARATYCIYFAPILILRVRWRYCVPYRMVTRQEMNTCRMFLLSRVLQCSMRPKKASKANEVWNTVHNTRHLHHISSRSPLPVNPDVKNTLLSQTVIERLNVSDKYFMHLTSWLTKPRLGLQPLSIATTTDTFMCHTPTPLPTHPVVEASSVLKKRRRKMNKHKHKKWRKKYRFLRRRLGK